MAEEGEKEPAKTSKSQESVSDARSHSESESQDSQTAWTSKPKEVGERPEATDAHLGTKKMAKRVERKRVRRVGAVTKRRVTRRPRRQPVKRRAQRPRIPSTSTIYGRGQSSSLLAIEQVCQYCGHRCCLRRYQKEKRPFRKKNKAAGVKSSKLRIESASVAVQAGPPAAALSPLFISSTEPPEQTKEEGTMQVEACDEITPEIIHLALRELHMWRQNVPTLAIYDYIRSNYPINPNPEEAMHELHVKLHIASLVGLIWALPNECWRLSTAIERINKLGQSHVTIFWKVYADTLKPLAMKPDWNLHFLRLSACNQLGRQAMDNFDDLKHSTSAGLTNRQARILRKISAVIKKI